MRFKNLGWVCLYAIAMAYVESAVVVYLRQLFGISIPMQGIPAFDSKIGSIEVGRELATLLMLLAVGWIAGKDFYTRFSYGIYAFGIWDIFYYLWLKLFIAWPQTIGDTDLLFLFPLPWWGPVISPVLIALLMVLGGALVVCRSEQGNPLKFSTADWIVIVGGGLLMLYAFMADAITLFPASTQLLSQMQPTAFKWPIYLVGLCLWIFILVRKWLSGSNSVPANGRTHSAQM